LIKYGKSNAEYIRKSAFFLDVEENERWLRIIEKIGEKYRQQPRREGCVACETPIGAPVIVVHGVECGVCELCGHLNGIYEDTPEFAEFLYAESGASGAAQVYGDQDTQGYRSRVESIYVPKAEFMCDEIRNDGTDPNSLTYADLGAGGGHFVMAMRHLGLENSIGYDSSPELVEGVNALFDTTVLKWNKVETLVELAATVEVDVVTMIFSLEHVSGLRKFLAALRSNKNVKYFYFAVPVFNPSVFLEAIFPDVRPRIMGVGHTHLFTDRSIDLLCEEFRLKRLADWWFGANAFDLLRTVSVKLQSDPSCARANETWNEMILPIMDELQLAFDHSKLASEVHLLSRFDG